MGARRPATANGLAGTAETGVAGQLRTVGGGVGAISWRLNLILVGLLAGLNLIQLIAIPVLLIPMSPYWGLLLVPLVFTTPALWSLIHEAIHGILHPTDAVNDGLGRGLSVLFGAPFRVLRLGHLMHHRFNRTDLDRTEVTGPQGAGTGGRMVYFARLLGGLYLAECAASLAAALPRRAIHRLVHLAFGAETPDGRTMMRAADRHLMSPAGIRQIRFDGLAAIALFGLAFYFYGASWWMLTLALVGRGLLISFFDNAYHYDTPLDDVLYSYNLRLPPVLARAMLNFNYHAVHHRHPALPWPQLATRFDATGDVYEGPFLSVAWRQLRGPLNPAEVAAGDRHR